VEICCVPLENNRFELNCQLNCAGRPNKIFAAFDDEQNGIKGDVLLIKIL
jgi:hypothetical protein